jgi:hypothetical protein
MKPSASGMAKSTTAVTPAADSSRLKISGEIREFSGTNSCARISANSTPARIRKTSEVPM